MPLRAGSNDKNERGAMEAALVQGLQQRYEVFAGEDVAQKSREIFSKESRTAKQNCDETRCMEDIAIAFQSELIATANVTHIEGGFLLVLSIRNVLDNKSVFSNSLPCRGCDVFQVVERLKKLSMTPADVISQNAARLKDVGVQERKIWQAAESSGNEISYQNYLRDYPRGAYAGLAHDRIHNFHRNTNATNDERSLWQMAQDRHSTSVVQSYLDKYPNGKYVVAARRRLRRLQKEEGAASQQTSQTGMPSAAERLRRAEAADKAVESSSIRALPGYLDTAIQKLLGY